MTDIQGNQQIPDKTDPSSLSNSTALQSLEPEFRTQIEDIYKKNFQLNNLIIDLHSPDILDQHQGCIGISKILQNNTIQNVIDSNCIPRFIKFIKQNNYPILQLEAASCLAIIAGGTPNQTKSVVIGYEIFKIIDILIKFQEFHFCKFCNLKSQNISIQILKYLLILKVKGAILHFCNLLTSPYSDTALQAAWAIGNIASDELIYRDTILKYNGLKPIANILLKTEVRKNINIYSWALSALCRRKPFPQYEFVKEAILPFCKVLMKETETEILENVSWGLYSLSYGDEITKQNIINAGIIPTLIRLISHILLIVSIPCLKTLGNICNGSDEQRDVVLQQGALIEIIKLVKHEKSVIRREACCALNNISKGNENQISQIINQNYIQILFHCMLNDLESIVNEVAWVINNCTSKANQIDIQKLVEFNILKIYKDLLKSQKNVDTLILILKSIKHILECGKKFFMIGNDNPFCIKLQEIGALESIKDLSLHPCEDIKKESSEILDLFFGYMIESE